MDALNARQGEGLDLPIRLAQLLFENLPVGSFQLKAEKLNLRFLLLDLIISEESLDLLNSSKELGQMSNLLIVDGHERQSHPPRGFSFLFHHLLPQPGPRPAPAW